jgi:hypothetical protein
MLYLTPLTCTSPKSTRCSLDDGDGVAKHVWVRASVGTTSCCNRLLRAVPTADGPGALARRPIEWPDGVHELPLTGEQTASMAASSAWGLKGF